MCFRSCIQHHTIETTVGAREEHTDYRDPVTEPNDAYTIHSTLSTTWTHGKQTSPAVPGPRMEESQIYEPIDKTGTY